MRVHKNDVELQIDKKKSGRVIRVNVKGMCRLRICQLPEKYFQTDMIDLIWPKEKR